MKRTRKLPARLADLARTGIDMLKERVQLGIQAAKAELADELDLGTITSAAEAAARDHRRAQEQLQLAQARANEAKSILDYARGRLRSATNLYERGCAEIEAAFRVPAPKGR
jgi:hypothetical protein